MSKNQESVGDQFTKHAVMFVYVMATIAIVTWLTNLFFEFDTTGRIVMGVILLVGFGAMVGGFAWTLRGTRTDAGWQELLTSVLEHPGRTSVNLGGLKQHVDERLNEQLADDVTPTSPSISIGAEKLR